MISRYEERETWTSVIGDVVQCQMKASNTVDKYAVGAMNEELLGT